MRVVSFSDHEGGLTSPPLQNRLHGLCMTVLRGGLVETPLKHAEKPCLVVNERSTTGEHRRAIRTCEYESESTGITSQLSFFALIVGATRQRPSATANALPDLRVRSLTACGKPHLPEREREREREGAPIELKRDIKRSQRPGTWGGAIDHHE